MATDPYRRDIDGLRGVAVLSVILFHIDASLLPGGFVGVDIFFVISGHLITLHILGEVEQGRFSLAEFYRRRIKRIIPAMLVVVACSLIVAQVLMIPSDAERVAESALWSIASIANLYFWLHHDTSYFAAASSEQPLLHLWSLGVEEQFYLLWPLVLAWCYRGKRGHWLIAAGAMGVTISLTSAQFLFAHDPSFVYYMLPTRAGELMIGALVAAWIVKNDTWRGPLVALPGIALLGLFLIAGSLIWIDESDVFPGWLAAPPTVGAALLILAGTYRRNLPTSKLLESRVLVWVGIVSYSAYLWHWPLLAFARYFGVDISLTVGAGVLAITFILAWATYRYVEQPGRRVNYGFLAVAGRMLAVPGLAIFAIGAASMKLDGYGPRWFSPNYKQQLATVQDQVKPAFQYEYVCQRQRVNSRDLANPACVVGPANGQPKILLWGDSNAAHYVGMLGVFAGEAGFSFRNVAIGSCPPLTSDPSDYVPSTRLADCRSSAGVIAAELGKYEELWISADWIQYQARSPRFLDQFEAMVRARAGSGTRIVLIGKAPVIAGYDRHCWEKSVSVPWMNCKPQLVPLAPEVALMNSRLRQMADSVPNVAYFDANGFLCRQGVCSSVDQEGHRRYFDSSHLSLEASWRLGNEILRASGVPAAFRHADPRLTPVTVH